MPLTWAQVKHGLNPKAFTLRTAQRLIAKSEAWKDYGKSQPSLKTIAPKLG
jgi:bifunctional non-homologous end joining protein LigD